MTSAGGCSRVEHPPRSRWTAGQEHAGRADRDGAPPQACPVVEASPDQSRQWAQLFPRAPVLGDQDACVDNQRRDKGPPHVAGPEGAQCRQRSPVPEQECGFLAGGPADPAHRQSHRDRLGPGTSGEVGQHDRQP